MAGLSFFKYEGLGNDFLLVEAAHEDAVPPERAARLCDRRFGVGADGVLLVLPPVSPGATKRMRVVNADGSVPEMCGNGLRCVALHVARARGAARCGLQIDTDAGTRRCVVDDEQGAGLVTVDMGLVRALGERTLTVGGRQVAVSLGDAGNPHAVLFGAWARGDVEQLGPGIATHPDFPNGTNVEFTRVDGASLDVIVWERGVGVTLACGTGACAAAAVARARGLLTPSSSPISVRLPGGMLEVSFDRDGRATMRGPARHVFSGTLAP